MPEPAPQFTPRFAADPANPLAGVTFETRESKITDRSGRIFFAARVTVPVGWSQTATDILAQKYMRKAGVPADLVPVPELGVPEWLWRRQPAPGVTTFGAETDARQVFGRLAGAWTYHGWKAGYFVAESAARVFYAEILRMLADQVAAPNSPQWFNTGLWWAYGIAGTDQGQWRLTAGGVGVEPSPRAYEYPGVGACFINRIDDSLVEPGGILDFTTREARIFKFGSGSGANYSPLRARGEALSGGGMSSGLPSFLRPIDRFAGAIKSGGTTRRAARMAVLDLDHPDVEWFVGWKVGEEHKVACLVAGSRVLRECLGKVYHAAAAGDAPALGAARTEAFALGVPPGSVDQAERRGRQGLPPPETPVFDTDYEGEAYETVSGQNANNSVSTTHAFMRAVAADAEWPLYHRTELTRAAAEGRHPAPCRTVKAAALWRQIAEAAWACADPGVQFVDTMNEWNTVLNDGKIKASNPCSEYLFLDDTTCNLACLNLVRLVAPADPEATAANFAQATRLWTYVLDITVGMSGYPAEAIARGAMNYRTFGLGYANLGALLMRVGVPYDSDAGRGWAAGLTALVHFGATTASAELASRLGTFPRCEANREHVLRVVSNHVEYVTSRRYEGLSVPPPDPSAWFAAAPAWVHAAAVDAARDAAAAVGAAGGLRNAQLTLVMPAGTVGLVMDCDTTGVEPDFALVKGKTLAGGGFMRIVNQSVGPALENLGYPPLVAAAVCEYVLAHGTIEGCPAVHPDHLPVFDTAVVGGAGTRSIAVEGHLLMMAAVQPLLSGGISKTVNMPAGATADDVRTTYTRAWALMVKCVAVYRDGSKLSQPLEAVRAAARTAAVGPLPLRGTRRRLPTVRPGHTAKLKVPGHKMYLQTGEFEDGTLGEIFLTWHKEGAAMKFWANMFAQAVSLGLQYGVPVDEFVEAFTFVENKPNGPVADHPRIKSCTSVIDLIFRHLGIHYAGRDDLAHTGETGASAPPPTPATGSEVKYDGTPCPSCGKLTLIRQAVCKVCVSCGTSTGCA